MYTDQDETKEAQENRIEYFKKKGNQKFTEDAEITVDLVLQVRAKLSDNKVQEKEKRPSRTLEPPLDRGDIAAGLHHWPDEKK